MVPTSPASGTPTMTLGLFTLGPRSTISTRAEARCHVAYLIAQAWINSFTS